MNNIKGLTTISIIEVEEGGGGRKIGEIFGRGMTMHD